MSPPQIIGDYRVTALLGKGGMGEVWRATDTRLVGEVAVKIIPENLARDAGRMTRFQRKAHVLAQYFADGH